jgi:hypothetical protein
MQTRRSGDWSRRRLLSTFSAALAPLFLPRDVGAFSLSSKPATRFSRFVDVAKGAGLTQPCYYGNNSRRTYILENMGAGCAFFDYDNDGWMDIFTLTGRTLEGVPPGASNRLYKNNRDGTFTDVTAKAGLTDCGWANGVCVGDYDNDGFEDLFVTYYGQNRLYHNNGDGTFTDVTAKAGLLHNSVPRYGAGCTFIDYNRDGLLDLFVSNYLEFDLQSAPKPSLHTPNCNYEGVAVNCGPYGFLPSPLYLYRNNGDGTFTDVSKESGIDSARGSFALTAAAVDIDEDGWTDIVVACDSSPSLLLLNNHDGTFREEAMLRGFAMSPHGELLGGMGLAIGDYDLDGHLDLVKTHFQKQATGLYRNNGKGELEDMTNPAGLAGERRFISWGTGLVDLDNDGLPDILVASGTVYPELESHYSKYPARCPRILFRNRGNGTFEELSGDVSPAISEAHISRGCAFGDFDNDGDLDVLIINTNEPPSLLRNDVPSGRHWLKVRLEGTRSNRSAIGARALAHYGGKVQAQCVLSQSSYLSSNDPRLHFGLGAETSADLEIYWPIGTAERFRGVAADQLVTIREGHGIVPGRPFHR